MTPGDAPATPRPSARTQVIMRCGSARGRPMPPRRQDPRRQSASGWGRMYNRPASVSGDLLGDLAQLLDALAVILPGARPDVEAHQLHIGVEDRSQLLRTVAIDDQEPGPATD